MRNLFKYLLLVVVSLAVIVCCSLFQHVAPVKGEYHFSSFLGKNYKILVAIIFFIISLGIGYYLQLNPWLTGLSLYIIFPFTAIAEAILYTGSHNLIPFEFIIYFALALPSIIAVYLGRFLHKRVAKRKQKVTTV